MNDGVRLPAGVEVIVRDWLNANHVVFAQGDRTVLIDSGYGRDAALMLDKVATALRGRPLDWLVNTHCHSDHMGGNAALQRTYRCRTSIPVGEAPLIRAWDDAGLWLAYADQRCEQFRFDDVISPGDTLDWGGLSWRALAAPGHDMGALMYFCEAERVLISGDALWEHGFGIILPGDGREERLAAARATLECIATLDVALVIPGHGAPFADVAGALERSLQRLAAFERDELRMARHVLKVMFVFALLDRGRIERAAVPGYLAGIPLYRDFNERYFGLDDNALAALIVDGLEAAGAVRRNGDWLQAA